MKRILFFIFIISLSATSCTDKDKDTIILNQEKSIEDYFNSKYPDKDIISKDGSYKVILEKGIDNTSLNDGDSVYFNYAAYLFSSTPFLFDTNIEELATTNKLNITDKIYSIKKSIYNKENILEGLYSGMDNMKNEEHSIIIFSAKHGFYDKNIGTIPSMSALMYEIWITKIKKN